MRDLRECQGAELNSLVKRYTGSEQSKTLCAPICKNLIYLDFHIRFNRKCPCGCDQENDALKVESADAKSLANHNSR